jgi:hypothetical protein
MVFNKSRFHLDDVAMPKIIDRQLYRPSGSVQWTRLAVATLMLTCFTILVAAAVNLVHQTAPGWTLYSCLVLYPAIGFGCHCTLRSGHCRNQWAAVVIGFWSALIVSIGPVACQTIDARGLQALGFMDWGEVLKLLTDFRNQVYGTNFGWALVVAEAAGIATYTIILSVAAVRAPYCEHSKKWMAKATIRLPATVREPLIQALNSKDHRALNGLTTQTNKAAPPYCELTLFYTSTLSLPNAVSESVNVDSAVPADSELCFLSIDEVNETLQKSRKCRTTPVARYLELSADEIEALLPAFPAIGAATVCPNNEGQPTDLSHVIPIEEHSRGRILSNWHICVENLVGIGPPILILGAMSALVFWMHGAGLGIGIVLAFCVFLTWRFGFKAARKNLYRAGAAYLKRVATRIIGSRQDVLVAPDEGVFVQIIPRAHWGKTMVENAVDVGFLRIDHELALVLFEGDQERWQIPVEQLESFDLEYFATGAKDENEDLFHVITLRIKDGGTLIERPIHGFGHGSGPAGNWRRFCRVKEIQSEIAQAAP